MSFQWETKRNQFIGLTRPDGTDIWVRLDRLEAFGDNVNGGGWVQVEGAAALTVTETASTIAETIQSANS